MAGYRTRRKTKASNFVAVNGTLKLPWAYSNSVDDYVAETGIFPEFFYNFNTPSGSVNMDIGLVFRGTSGWKVFACGPNVNTGGWYESSISVSAGQTVSIAVYTEDYKVIVRINDWHYIIPTTNGTAAAIRGGCWVTREANLVPQKSKNLTKCWLLQTNAYFVGAVWSNTTLTNTGGAYVKMSTLNTVYDETVGDNEPTDATVTDSNCITHTVSTSNSFVTDNCTIDFRNRNKNICS